MGVEQQNIAADERIAAREKLQLPPVIKPGHDFTTVSEQISHLVLRRKFSIS